MRATLAFLFLCLGLGACSPSPERAHAKLDRCAQKAGITGAYQVKTVLANGRTSRTILPGPGVSPDQAAQATRCGR